MSSVFGGLLSSAIEFYDKGIYIFGLDIAWYGIILTTGMICGLILFTILSKREKIEPEFCLTTFLFAIVFAIIGARFVFVMTRPQEYFASWQDFGRAFDITEGGLTIMGGIPFGALGVYVSCRISKKSFVRVCDLAVPCLLLGQVIGRWGNYVNGEVFGFEITNPALQHFPIAVWVYHEGEWGWHAAQFFYEMMLNLLMLIVILILTYTIKKKLKVGFLTFLYILWYGLVRGCMEFVRVGHVVWGGIVIAQFAAFFAAALALLILILLQVGVIKFETPRMYERHFQLVHEPPPYIEKVSEQIEVDCSNLADSASTDNDDKNEIKNIDN